MIESNSLQSKQMKSKSKFMNSISLLLLKRDKNRKENNNETQLYGMEQTNLSVRNGAENEFLFQVRNTRIPANENIRARLRVRTLNAK